MRCAAEMMSKVNSGRTWHRVGDDGFWRAGSRGGSAGGLQALLYGAIGSGPGHGGCGVSAVGGQKPAL